MKTTAHENCGGTILTAGAGMDEHEWCNRCGAYRYVDTDPTFPTGTDRDAIAEAWDAGEARSPDAR